jgi:hypothetical protein
LEKEKNSEFGFSSISSFERSPPIDQSERKTEIGVTPTEAGVERQSDETAIAFEHLISQV